ncbi:MAG: type II toxin-antitoxin system RelE/ParE family toxin [Nitrospinales bacterium]
MFSLKYSKAFLKKIDKIPGALKTLIRKKLKALKANPVAKSKNIKRLKNTNNYRPRIGDWRVIYRIEKKESIIYLIEINTRGDVYK